MVEFITRERREMLSWRAALSFLIHPLYLSSKQLRLWKFTSLVILAGLVIGSNLLPITGFDWFVCWLDYVKHPATNQFPTWIYLGISPIAALPNSWHWFNVFSLIVTAGAVLAADFSFPWLMLTLPVVWIFFYGQVDNWVALGAVLGLFALKKKNPYLGGAAALLLTAKPHLGMALALFYLWKFRGWKVLVVPGAVLLISFAAFGFWPAPYVETILTQGVDHLVRQNVNISLFPWSLAVLPLLAVTWKKLSDRQRATAIYAATCLIVPYVPVYSLIPLLFMLNLPLLGLLLFPAWVSTQVAVVFGGLFAACVLGYTIFLEKEGNG